MNEMADPAEALRAEPKTMVNIVKRAIIYGFNTMPRPPHGLGCGDLGDWMYEQVARGVIASISQWQPIETAPKETEVLICTDCGSLYLGTLYPYGWSNGELILERMGAVVTRWMPLPEPPPET